MNYCEIYERFNEFETTAHKKLVKMFQEFNKKFFKNELPEVEIKITNKDTKDSKGVAGSFNFPPEAKVNNKTYKLKDLRKKGSNLKDLDKEVYDFIVANSFIEVPKDCVKKGKYYCAAILLHEMTHEYIELISKSSQTEMHGSDFRKKIDEINKKSNNEYRVPYEEVPEILKSDKPLEKRPEDALNESILNKFKEIYKRFNETTTDDAVKHLMKPIKSMIDNNKRIDASNLKTFGTIMHIITNCEDGLINEDTGKSIFGLEAINYIFWKLVHSANKDSTGCNSKELLDWFKANTIIGHTAFENIKSDEEVMEKHKRLLKDKKYAEDCYAKILANIEASLI